MGWLVHDHLRNWFYLVLPQAGSKRGTGSGDPAYNRRVGGARGSFFGFTWLDRGGDGGPTDYAAPLELRLLFGVWFYKYFAPLALGMGVDSD